MAIDFGVKRGRKVVAWLREDPPPQARDAFEQRNFGVKRCDDTDLAKDAYLAGLGAVVLTQRADKLRHVVDDLKRYARRLLDFDCGVIVRFVAPSGHELVQNAVRDDDLPADAGLRKAGNDSERPHVRGYG
jgi:hypothetical protein